MSVIDRIAAAKRARLETAKGRVPLGELKARAADTEAPLDFRGAISRPAGAEIRLIAEVKRASPSRGLIRAGFDPAAIAAIYREKADAISVLTEEDFFQGDLGYIQTVKGVAGRPVLRKDFVLEEYQIYESRAAGADAVLLIESLLEARQAEEYLHMLRDLGLSALFEVHDLRGLEKALRAGAGIIGINNRDLTTLKVDLETTFRILREMPAGHTVVSESGINTRRDVLRLEEAGVDAMLVGTALMEAVDVAKKIDELRRG
ncbi:MAG: indole-3-glycerol phosphate synthase TrpC [Thermodesulfovibrionales bacterium]